MNELWREENGVVELDLDGNQVPVQRIVVLDAGGNVIARGTAAQLELLERRYANELRTGQYTIVGE